MPEILSKEALNTMIFFAVLSILFCTAQVLLRRKMNFLPLCKVSVAVPLLSIIIRAMFGISSSLTAIAHANDLSRQMLLKGYANLLYSLAIGIIVTICLVAFYAFTKSIYVNSLK